jgi:calcium uptake protein 1, mitochondrial
MALLVAPAALAFYVANQQDE